MKMKILSACFSPRNQRAFVEKPTATGQLALGQIPSVGLAASLVFALLYIGIGAVAQTVTLPLVNDGLFRGAGSTNFHVPSNVVAQVIYAYLPGVYGVSMRVSCDNAPALNPAYYGPGTISNLPTVVGPATINLSYTNSNTTGAGLAFITIQTSSSTSITPSTAVVIPNDGGGPVTIILESSVDLINWTPALPGTYGTANSNRFFRVRAQR
jgi:hypothetical protein